MNETTDPSPAPEPSLDDVISEFNVHAPASEPTPAPITPQTVTHSVPNTFDPLDQESVNQYVQQSSQGVTALTSQVQELNQKLTQYEQQQNQVRVEADIKTAVQTVNEKVNADPLMVELYLEKMAREKPGFQQIWNNREQNPNAFKKALDAVSNELQGKFDVKSDPELVKNQAAAKQSQQSMSTSNQPDDDLPEPGTPEHAVWWEKLKASG